MTITFDSGMTAALAAEREKTDISTSMQINVMSFYDTAGSAWKGAKNDGTTDDSAVINAAIVEAQRRAQLGTNGYCYVYFPPGTGYALSGSINLLNSVGLVGEGTKIIAKAALTGPVIDFTESRAHDGSNYFAQKQVAIKGFIIDASAMTCDVDIIHQDDLYFNGQIVENLNLEGNDSYNVRGIAIYGAKQKYHNVFRNIQFYRCKHPYGAFYFMGSSYSQANNLLLEGLVFNVCLATISVINCDDLGVRHCMMNPPATSPIHISSGLITEGLYPHVFLHNTYAYFDTCYFENITGGDDACHVWCQTTSAAPVRSMVTINDGNHIPGASGVFKPDNIVIVYCNGIYDHKTTLITKTGASTFTLAGNYATTFGSGTVYGYNGTTWASMGTCTAAFSSSTGYTTVTMSGAVPDGLEMATKTTQAAVEYTSGTSVTSVSTTWDTNAYKGKIVYLLSDTAIVSARSNGYSGAVLSIVESVAAAGIHTFLAHHPASVPKNVAINRPGVAYRASRPYVWTYPVVGDGYDRVISLDDINDDVMIMGPADLSAAHSINFRLTIVGDASTEYNVCWGKNISAKLASVPAGWTALCDFLWNGTTCFSVGEKLIYKTTATPTWSAAGSLADAAYAEEEFTLPATALPSDKVSLGWSYVLNTYHWQVSGRLVVTDGTTKLRARITNRSGGNRTPTNGTNGLEILLERDVWQAEQSGRTYTHECRISNTAVKALRATPITLIPAPGAGKWVEFLGATLIHDYATGAFTESSDDLVIEYATSGVDVSASIDATNFLTAVADTAIQVAPATLGATALSSLVNNAIQIKNTGDGEYADGGGTMQAIVNYRIHDDTV